MCTVDIMLVSSNLLFSHSLPSKFLMCGSYQDLSGLNFKLTLQERSF